MRILLAATLLAAACTQAQPKPAPEATREAAGQRVDAGQQAANEPGGSAMGTEDAGARQAVKDAADAGQQAAADAGQDVAGGIKQGASEAAGNVASGTKEAAQNVAQGASEAGRVATGYFAARASRTNTVLRLSEYASSQSGSTRKNVPSGESRLSRQALTPYFCSRNSAFRSRLVMLR